MFWLTLWILNRYFGDFYESKKVYVEQLKYFDWRFNLDSLNYFAENTRKISLTFNSKIADYLIGKYIRIVSFYEELFISKGQLSLESVFYHLSRIYQASLFKSFREDVQDTWYWEPPPPCPIVQRHPRAVVNAYKYRTYTYHPWYGVRVVEDMNNNICKLCLL